MSAPADKHVRVVLDAEPPNHYSAQAQCDCGWVGTPWLARSASAATKSAIMRAEDDAFAHRCKTDHLIEPTIVDTWNRDEVGGLR